MTVTYPVWTVVDDSGAIVTGATVTIASVKDKAGADIASPGATVNMSGANVSVDYDADAKGEAWVVLSVSKAGSTFTGINASPAFFLAKDSSRILAGIPAAGAAPSWYTAPSNPSDYARNNVAPSWYTSPPTPPDAPSIASAVWETSRGMHNAAGSFGWFLQSIPGFVWDVSTADHAEIGTFGLETVTMLPPNPWETEGFVKASPAPTAHQFKVANVQGVLGTSRLSLGIDAPGIGGKTYRVFTATDAGASSPGPGRDYLVTMLDDLPIAPAETSGVYFETARPPHAGDLAGYKLASDGLDLIPLTPAAGVATTFREAIVAVWRYLFKPANRTPLVIETLADDGTTVLTTQPITDDGSGNETRGTAVAP